VEGYKANGPLTKIEDSGSSAPPKHKTKRGTKLTHTGIKLLPNLDASAKVDEARPETPAEAGSVLSAALSIVIAVFVVVVAAKSTGNRSRRRRGDDARHRPHDARPQEALPRHWRPPGRDRGKVEKSRQGPCGGGGGKGEVGLRLLLLLTLRLRMLARRTSLSVPSHRTRTAARREDHDVRLLPDRLG